MSQTALRQKRELEKLERAAEDASEPEHIEKKADRPHKKPSEKVPPFWFLPYLILAAICGGGILLLQWKSSLFSTDITTRVHRYLLGGLTIVAVLAFARGLEVYAIARVRTAAGRSCTSR